MAPFRVRNILPNDTCLFSLILRDGQEIFFPSPEVAQTFRRLPAYGQAAWASHELHEAVTALLDNNCL